MLKKYITKIINEEMFQVKKSPSVSYVDEECEPMEEGTEETMRFSLTPAIGGRILRSMRRNKHGNREEQLYVIPSGEDVGERVAKILNLELLK